MLNDRHLQLEFWQSSEMTHHQVWLTPNYSSLKNTPWTSFVKSMSRITCRFLFVSYPFSFFSAMIAKCLKLFFRFLFHQFNRFWRIFLPWPRKSVWYTTKRQTLFSFNIVETFGWNYSGRTFISFGEFYILQIVKSIDSAVIYRTKIMVKSFIV